MWVGEKEVTKWWALEWECEWAFLWAKRWVSELDEARVVVWADESGQRKWMVDWTVTRKEQARVPK